MEPLTPTAALKAWASAVARPAATPVGVSDRGPSQEQDEDESQCPSERSLVTTV